MVFLCLGYPVTPILHNDDLMIVSLQHFHFTFWYHLCLGSKWAEAILKGEVKITKKKYKLLFTTFARQKTKKIWEDFIQAVEKGP